MEEPCSTYLSLCRLKCGPALNKKKNVDNTVRQAPDK